MKTTTKTIMKSATAPKKLKLHPHQTKAMSELGALFKGKRTATFELPARSVPVTNKSRNTSAPAPLVTKPAPAVENVATKSMTKVTAQVLTNSMLNLEARIWINQQNDREFQRRTRDGTSEVFFFNGRAGKLNRLQLDQFTIMQQNGWQAMCVAVRGSTNEFALVCRGASNGMYGILYPDGTLDRTESRIRLKNSRWDTRETQVAAEDEVPAVADVGTGGDRVTIRIPQAVEQTPSHVVTKHHPLDVD